MAYLKSVPATPSWLPKPRSGTKFKITLWLDPSTYFMLIRQSAELEAGNLSVHKWIKHALGLENAKKFVERVDGRTALATVRHIKANNRPQAIAAAARRRRQPRKVAA